MKKLIQLLFTIVFVAMPSAIMAQHMPTPHGEIILEVQGDIETSNQVEGTAFDIQMLQGLEVKTYETQTPWSDNSYRFRGATLASVLETVGAKDGAVITLYALDGYQVDISWKDATEFKPILAYSRNNVPMSRRDRGPLWLVFPLSEHSELNDARYDNFWVWQIIRIEVK